MDLRLQLIEELERRQRSNPRYSLRAFARWLGMDHTALSQIVQRKRRLTQKAIERLGKRLSVPDSEIAEAVREENRSAILNVIEGERFRPSSRWIAMMAGIPMDDVNVGLHELISSGRLEMQSQTTWKSKR